MLEIHVSEFAGARPSATRQKRHADPGEPSCSPCSAAARPVYGDVVAAAYPDTLRRTPLRTRRRTCSTAGTASMHVGRRKTQEEFFGHSHEVSGEPQDTPGVLDEQRLTVATAQTPRLEKAAEPDVKPPETPATGEPRPGSNPTLRATCFCSTGSSASGKQSPCGGRRDARYRATPGVVAIALGRMIRPLLRLAFGRIVAKLSKCPSGRITHHSYIKDDPLTEPPGSSTALASLRLRCALIWLEFSMG
jgi:hypothetical protein